MMLSDAVTVARRFQRSVRVDTDLGAAAALHGFVCQGSGRAALNTMARLIVDAGQRAFTWTGPYGSGKSSLALALAAAVGPHPGLRKTGAGPARRGGGGSGSGFSARGRGLACGAGCWAAG
jgi:hypothetical protein